MTFLDALNIVYYREHTLSARPESSERLIKHYYRERNWETSPHEEEAFACYEQLFDGESLVGEPVFKIRDADGSWRICSAEEVMKQQRGE